MTPGQPMQGLVGGGGGAGGGAVGKEKFLSILVIDERHTDWLTHLVF